MKAGNSENDLGLVEACISGDITAWASLAKKYERLGYISIENRLKKYGFTLPRQDIEEICQDVITSIWKDRKLETVKNRKDISYWFSIVSGNAAIEFMRAKKVKDEPKSVPMTDEIAEELIAPDCLRDDDLPAPDTRKDISKKLARSIETLKYKEKLILKLNIYHAKKYHEIAEMLNMPKGTVSNYLKRAKDKLKENLENL